jgi:hypothetical protein
MGRVREGGTMNRGSVECDALCAFYSTLLAVRVWSVWAVRDDGGGEESEVEPPPL